MKYEGVGVDLALQKDNQFGDPRFLFFFLKGIIIVRKMKINSSKFQHQISSKIIYSKYKFEVFDELQKYSMQYLVTAKVIK